MDRRPKYSLQALTLRARAALYLHDEGLTDREIAERWGAKVPNIARTLRARGWAELIQRGAEAGTYEPASDSTARRRWAVEWRIGGQILAGDDGQCTR